GHAEVGLQAAAVVVARQRGDAVGLIDRDGRVAARQAAGRDGQRAGGGAVERVPQVGAQGAAGGGGGAGGGRAVVEGVVPDDHGDGPGAVVVGAGDVEVRVG